MSGRVPKLFDPRIYAILLLAAAIAGLMVHDERSLLAMFIIALLWKFLSKNAADVLLYVFGYIVLWTMTYLALLWLKASPDATLAISLSNTGLAGRKAFVPFIFAFILAKQATGSLIAAFSAMGFPKPFGISIALLLRFFPTLAYEYRSIRNAQKFRGVGLGFWNPLAHIPQVLNYILIPLSIRITRISEELSASLSVRGVNFNNTIVSYRPVRFSLKDGIALSISIAALLFIIIIDYYSGLIR